MSSGPLALRDADETKDRIVVATAGSDVDAANIPAPSTIENNLPLPARHSLSMEIEAPLLLCPPAVPRRFAHVGLSDIRTS